ncbi:diguanylate cyclase [Saccharopolyspora sp. HNM0986]|uniref:GGDEF domain-containing protein n=1 Tax=Saccharopolyspora galaxeae TaxID=2781241 RepID=UPI00190910D5|nr:diguanylate cyclase [Saccharopolyspora sp. HNM0986]MBK0865272.1 diguanylate cyclase [Saccharopolyspora sp. HNM0986]
MALWPRLRAPALIYGLLVETAALAAVLPVVLGSSPPSPGEWLRFSMLAATAGVVIIATSVSIRVRSEVRRDPWTVHTAYLAAGGLTLPPDLLVLLLVGPGLHAALERRPEPHRWLFVSAATVWAVFAARWVIGWRDPAWNPVLIVLAGTVLLLVRAALVAIGLRLRDPDARGSEVLGESADVLLGIVAACFGGVLGMAVLREPGVALLGAPVLALLDLAGQLPHWRRSAQRDGKTGLANALHWDRLARAELRRACARQQPTAVLLLDLDHFKRVNDEVGHMAGDAVLAAVALTLRGSVRKDDVVGRFGGEEFVVLLPTAAPEVARVVADRIRLAIAALSVPTRDTLGEPRELCGVTVSAGVATSVRFGYELGDLLAAADAALMQAKSAGRNAVTVA